MPISIQVQGPIHAIPKWTRRNKCVDYGGSHCAWEAKISITVNLDFSKTLEALRDQYAENYTERHKAKGATKTSGKRAARRAQLFLIQEITKTVSISGESGECVRFTENVLDMWLLPESGESITKDDVPTKGIQWSLECGKAYGCLLKTDWDADVYVALVVKDGGGSDIRTEKLDLGSDDQGTVALTRTYSKQPPERPRDPGLAGADDAPQSKEWATPDQFKAEHSFLEPADEKHARYKMKPIVPHCGRSRSVLNRDADPDENGIPATLTSDGEIPPAYSADDLKLDSDGNPIVPPTKGTVIRDSYKSVSINEQERSESVRREMRTPEPIAGRDQARPRSARPIEELGEFWERLRMQRARVRVPFKRGEATPMKDARPDEVDRVVPD